MINQKQAQQDALKEYEKKQAQIRKLLKQIEAGLEKHDRKASSCRGGHHWGHAGDLEYVVDRLTEVNDFLNQTGEYAEVG